MVFNLKNSRDLILVVVLLFIFNIIEYFIPSKLTSVSAYVIGALSFICSIEICQYLIKPYTPKKSRNFTFILFLIGFSLLFYLSGNLFNKPYIYGTYAGSIIAIILKLFQKKVNTTNN
jgi:hypothetical protein